jgi:hypothetical protein
MNFSNINIGKFIETIIKYNSVNEILNKCKSQSEKGFIFERLFDIVIKFGFIFSNKEYNHLIGNVNTGKLKIMKNFDDYLTRKVISGNSSGCSDITLLNKETETYIFISSKYPKTTEDKKSISYYDIQNIIAMATKNKYIYKKYKIYLIVPNGKTILEKVKTANKSSDYITEHMKKDNILDEEILNKCFLEFKQDIIKNKNKSYNEIYLSKKEKLKLRFHQELITQKTSKLIEEGNKSFLWGCKCRSGKTYMIGGIIIKQYDVKKKLNVLIITPAPSETIPQFTEDLFNNFKDFDNFKIHDIKNSKSLENIKFSESNIFVMSKQLLQNYINENTITKIRDLKLDIIGFDENHFSGTTDLSKDILKSYSTKNTVKIYLTATYNKPLNEWNISPECQMYWDIEDEQICKSILIDENNISKLEEKHGKEYVTKTIEYFMLPIKKIFECYEKMPDLHLITNMFDSQRYEMIKEKLNIENKMGFCFDTLFGLNKLKTRFTYENEVKLILRYISGSCKETDGEKTIFTRINKLCTEKESRIPFTQLWFLPSDNINFISLCLKKLMEEDLILSKYDILCINRRNKDLAKDVKNEINKHEIEAHETGKTGVILLTGNMLSLGITLNLCDVVILMNNTLSSDKVLQQMYRCMSEANNKKFGIVVDLNISRVLYTSINYNIKRTDLTIEDKIKYLIENHLINIDVDIMENKKINVDVIVNKLITIWKEDPINNFRMLLRKLDNDYEEFDNSTQELINKTFTQSVKENKINVEVEVKDDKNKIQELPTGKEKIVNSSSTESDANKESEDIKEIQISFTKDVLPYIIPLSCILTMKDKNMDFVKMLNDVKENPELIEIFDDQCLIWWSKKDLIDMIKDIINKYFDKTSNTYNVSIQFKLSLQSLIDKPKELLELINDCLKPKETEKKKFGEVFTPISLINEMLDVMPAKVFQDKKLKWFDPANGMGNFPIVVYLRLMEGLKDVITDADKRKKHILEKMLYMSELNKKNCLVCKQIFDIENKYKLNIYNGDSLELDIKKEFNIDKFDIIMGNPPYNKGGIRSHTGKLLGEKNETIWTKFIELSFKYIKKDGFLILINPLSWLKKSHSLHDMILNKHIIWMKLWDNIKSLACINGKIPISMYVIHNKLNTNNKDTKIISEIKSKNLRTETCTYLNSKYSIPLAYYGIFNKLINFIETNDCKLEYETKTVKSEGKKIKLPEKYELKDMLAVDTYTMKEGIMVKKINIEHPDMKTRKLIIANKASMKGSFIDNGLLGLTGNHKYYIVGNELKLIQKILNFKIIEIISHLSKYGQDFLDKDVFNYIPDIRKMNIKKIMESEFYKMINLTNDEIEIIKKFK